MTPTQDLEVVLRSALPILGEGALLDVQGVEPGSMGEPFAHGVTGTASDWLAVAADGIDPSRLADPRFELGPAIVIYSGRAEVFLDVEHEARLALRDCEWSSPVHSGRGAEHLRFLEELGVSAYVCVPLVSRDRTIGTLTFVKFSAGERFGHADVELAGDLARRIAVAIDNARLHATMERRREELELANKSKDVFLATLSHELRTPLNAIVGWTDMMKNGLLAGDELCARDRDRRPQRARAFGARWRPARRLAHRHRDVEARVQVRLARIGRRVCRHRGGASVREQGDRAGAHGREGRRGPRRPRPAPPGGHESAVERDQVHAARRDGVGDDPGRRRARTRDRLRLGRGDRARFPAPRLRAFPSGADEPSASQPARLEGGFGESPAPDRPRYTRGSGLASRSSSTSWKSTAARWRPRARDTGRARRSPSSFLSPPSRRRGARRTRPRCRPQESLTSPVCTCSSWRTTPTATSSCARSSNVTARA